MADLRTYSSFSGLLQVKKITKDIVQLIYKDRESLCKALLRPEEHYEGAFYKGKIFTLGEYRKWYCDFYGAWTYYKDWSGFNIPSSAFKPFIDGDFDPLTPEEQEIVDIFRFKQGKYCVIGTFEGGDADVYEHEICHAMYATNDNYKNEVNNELQKHDLTDIMDVLKNTLGYSESVLLDEAHAYICESSSWLEEKKVEYPKELIGILKQIKEKYKHNK